MCSYSQVSYLTVFQFPVLGVIYLMLQAANSIDFSALLIS